jgi:hypothetical protein
MAMIGGTNEASVNENNYAGNIGGGGGNPGDIGGIGGVGYGDPGAYSGSGDAGGGSIGDWLGGVWDSVDNAVSGGFDWGNAVDWGMQALTAGSFINPGLGPVGGLFAGILGGILGEEKNKYNQTPASRDISLSPQGVPGSGGEDRDDSGLISDLTQQFMGGAVGGGGGASVPIARGKKPGKPSGLYGSEEAPGSIRRYLKSSEDDDLAADLAFGKDEFTKRLF